MIITKAVVSSVANERYRVLVGNRVSAPIPQLVTTELSAGSVSLSVGQAVAVVFFGDGLADGVVLGVIP